MSNNVTMIEAIPVLKPAGPRRVPVTPAELVQTWPGAGWPERDGLACRRLAMFGVWAVGWGLAALGVVRGAILLVELPARRARSLRGSRPAGLHALFAVWCVRSGRLGCDRFFKAHVGRDPRSSGMGQPPFRDLQAEPSEGLALLGADRPEPDRGPAAAVSPPAPGT